jgi:hypothetical protein
MWIQNQPQPDVDPVVTDTTTVKGGGGESYIECDDHHTIKDVLEKRVMTQLKKLKIVWE